MNSGFNMKQHLRSFVFLWAAVMTIVSGVQAAVQMFGPKPIYLDSSASKQLVPGKVQHFSLGEKQTKYVIDPDGGIVVVSVSNFSSTQTISSVTINGTVQDGRDFGAGSRFSVLSSDSLTECHITIARVGWTAFARAKFGYHCD